MLKSESIKELATALAKAQAEVENASKSSTNPHFKSKYADLAEIINTVRPVFSSHGLSVVQMPAFADGVASVETTVMHTSGEWMSGISSCTVTKNDAQGVGSATTYLRRYSLAAIACIAQEDDDGNAAVGKKPEVKVEAKPDPVITQEQFDIIADLIIETNTDAKKFNEAMKIDSLAVMPASKFEHAKMRLEKKKDVK